eukprot:153664-Chlamydomonas_euryale.AAC.2
MAPPPGAPLWRAASICIATCMRMCAGLGTVRQCVPQGLRDLGEGRGRWLRKAHHTRLALAYTVKCGGLHECGTRLYAKQQCRQQKVRCSRLDCSKISGSRTARAPTVCEDRPTCSFDSSPTFAPMGSALECGVGIARASASRTQARSSTWYVYAWPAGVTTSGSPTVDSRTVANAEPGAPESSGAAFVSSTL